MNRITEHTFLRIAESKEAADDLAFGFDVYDSKRFFYEFKTLEVITQYFWLPIAVEITDVKLVGQKGEQTNAAVNWMQLNPVTRLVVISFAPKEKGCQRLLINDIYHSTKFDVTDKDNNMTNLITYWNESSIYTLDYEGVGQIPQQIRLPIWYIGGKVESQAKEVKFDSGKPTTKIIYAPEIDYTNVYNCAFSNWGALRFSSAVSSDNVYLNFKKITPVSFEPKDNDNGSDFSISEWEVQYIYKDNELIELEYDLQNGIIQYHYSAEHYNPEQYDTNFN